MNLIEELSNVINNSTNRNVRNYLPKESKLSSLYELVHKQKVYSDVKAANQIYQTGPEDKRYLMLKTNLIKKLVGITFMEDPVMGDKKSYLNVKFKEERRLITAEKLLSQNVYHNAEKMALKAYKRAGKYFLTEIQLKATRILRMTYALKGDTKETRLFNKLTEGLARQFQDEMQIIGTLEIVESGVKFKAMPTEKEMYVLDKLEAHIPQQNNPFSQLCLLKLVGFKAIHDWDLHNLEKILKDIGELLSLYPFIQSNRLVVCHKLMEIQCLKWLGRPDQAQIQLSQGLKLTAYESFDKYAYMAEAFELAMKLEHYVQAQQIMAEVKTSNQYSYLNKKDKARWYMYSIYLQLFTQPEHIDDHLLNLLKQHLKNLKHDKSGYYLQGLFLKVLLVKHLNQGTLYDELNALKVHCNRHPTAQLPRTNVFFKAMLKLLMGKKQKHKEVIDHLKNELKCFPFQEPMECIPYERFILFYS